MPMERKELFEIRRTAARTRLDEAKSRRKARTGNIERTKLGANLKQRFSSCIYEYKDRRDDEMIRAEIKTLVSQVLSDYGVTQENLKNRTSGRQQLWDTCLNPLYNSFRKFISSSKTEGNDEAIRSFWNIVANELRAQLGEIASNLKISPNALGSPDYVFENELNSSTDRD